jgi:hypothetical protein
MTLNGSYQGLGSLRNRQLKRAAQAAKSGTGAYSKAAGPRSSSTSHHSKAAAMVAMGALNPCPPPPPPSSSSSGTFEAQWNAAPPPTKAAAPCMSKSAAPVAHLASSAAAPVAHLASSAAAPVPPADDQASQASPEYNPFEEEPLVAAASGSTAAPGGSIVVDCKISSSIAELTFASSSLATLFLKHPFAQAELSGHSNTVVYIRLFDHSAFNPVSLADFVADWLQLELDEYNQN